jgi:hypothetical protein
MIQTGYHRSTITGENCGSSGNVDVFVEWNPLGTPLYKCSTFSTSNTGDKFGVVKSSPINYWGAYRNGVLLGVSHDVGFINAGYALVGGERHQAYAYISGCWGCGGTTAWQFSTTGGSSYQNIGTADKFNTNNGGWVSDYPPSPLTVHD